MKRMIIVIAASATVAGCVKPGGGPPSANIEAIVPAGFETAFDEYHYSPAVRAGDFIFLSGIVAMVPQSAELSESATADEQLVRAYEGAFRSIEYVLSEAGADWSSVVEIMSFHTDLVDQLDSMTEVKDRYVGAPYPVWTAIDVDRLLPDNGVTEIRIVAYAPRR